jgi:two-component system, OmpR family, sensor histidine kinase KdpD
MAENDEARPTPEALLDEAKKEGRGRLKIFLGAYPGVGKTYSMLEAARAHRREGIDVVVGIVETHGRVETEALLRGLDVLPRKRLLYRERVFGEMDIDALLWRKPKLAIVDELAHTNVPGSRHTKRWQDVEELLAAGIDVYTTLNIQHLESLNDVVARISRVRVRETLPDKVLELADEIELIDLPPDDLIQRLREGKVYVPDQVGRAIRHFFGKGNLTALRELAMRAAAARVDAQMVDYMRAHAIAGPWPTQDRLLVCVNESPVAKKLVRTAKRMADRAHIPWIAVNVHTPRHDSLPDDAKDRIAEALRLAETLGGETATLHAESDVATELLGFAQSRNVSRLLLGRPRRRRWSGWLRERVTRRLLAQAGQFEVTIVTPEEEAAPGQVIQSSVPALKPDLRAFGWATLAVAVAVAISHVAERFLPLANLSLIFLMAVLFAATRFGLWPSVYASLLSFVAYNFFFTEPYHTFIVAHRGDVLTMVFFLIVAVIVANLAARLKAQVEAMRTTAKRTANLYDFSRKIVGAASLDDVLWAAVHHVASTLQCHSLVMLPRNGRLEIAAGYPPEDQISPTARGAAQWAWEHGQSAGWSSDTLPASEWLFLPLGSARGRVGLLGVAFENPKRRLTPEQRRLLEALIDQVALAIERTNLASDIEDARLLTETERLRAALLSSVSHDLRTPLVSIIGSATSLASCEVSLSSTDRAQLLQTILEEGERLNRFVQNLLDMTRLGYGALHPNRDWVDLRDIVGRAVHQLAQSPSTFEIEVRIPETVPLLYVDPVLIEQVLVNILDNATKHSPPGGRIEIAAALEGDEASVRVSDEGPGIPADARETVFDVFYRVRAGDQQTAGTGLGLSICRGLIEAHGGRIEALPGPGGQGTTIAFRIPVRPVPEMADGGEEGEPASDTGADSQ